MKNLYFMCSIFFVCANLLIAQPEETPVISKFNIHLEATSLVLINSTSVNFEGLVGSSTKGNVHVYVKLGVGSVRKTPILCESLKASGGILAVTILTGKDNNHFELNVGTFFGSFKVIENSISIFNCHYGHDELGFKVRPRFDLGYRFQKPEGGIIFRVNAGVSGLGAGLGYAF